MESSRESKRAGFEFIPGSPCRFCIRQHHPKDECMYDCPALHEYHKRIDRYDDYYSSGPDDEPWEIGRGD